MKWFIAFLIFSLLVLFHEFGHFLFARINGVDVVEFSIGFGPRLLSAVWGGTRYSLKLLLFGGSCQLRGMYTTYGDEESGKEGEGCEEGSFQSVSVGRRASIIFAGPFFNFVLAFLCSIIVISVVGYDPPEILYVSEGSAAEAAGLKTGDVVTRYMGDRIVIGRDIATWEVLHDYSADREIVMTVERDGEKLALSFKPDTVKRFLLGLTYMPEDERAAVETVQEGSALALAGVRAGDVIVSMNGTPIGTAAELGSYIKEHPLDGSEVSLTIQRGEERFDVTVTPTERENLSLGFMYNLGRVRTNAFGVLRYSLTELRYWITTTVRSLGAMFTGRFTVNDLSGPVGIVDMVGETYEESKSAGPLLTWMNMLNLIILLSANLGVMNLLPIPAIDGGRLLFLLLEAVRGKPVNEKVELSAQTVAAFLLLLLMFYILYHDIVRMMAP